MSGWVHVYAQDRIPAQNDGGPENRLYSNLRAYSDLGFDVELVYFRTPRGPNLIPDPTLDGVKWTAVSADSSGTRVSRTLRRGAAWLGRPRSLALDHQFVSRPLVRAAVRERHTAAPGALHHFEYLATASAIPDVPHVRSIWSLNDIESRYTSELYVLRETLEERRPSPSERRALARTRQAEQLVAQASKLVLCIGSQEREELREQWGCEHAEYFPMSIPREDPPTRTRSWGAGGMLRLLHVGGISSVPGYQSLQFILSEVLPRLGEETLARLELHVVGAIGSNPRTAAVRAMAARFPCVQLLDFQEDLRPHYAGADLQLVGCLAATGIRTRIIESLAYGVPVLSTGAGAAGLEGLCPEENILLADEPGSYAGYLEKVLRDPARLEALAMNARATYDARYSRTAIADRLGALLRSHFDVTARS